MKRARSSGHHESTAENSTAGGLRSKRAVSFRAIGANRGQILTLFIGEAVVLASIGGFAGLIIGAGGAWLLGATVPALPTHTPWLYVLLAEILAVVIGLLAGVLPALKAANLNPIEALRAE